MSLLDDLLDDLREGRARVAEGRLTVQEAAWRVAGDHNHLSETGARMLLESPPALAALEEDELLQSRIQERQKRGRLQRYMYRCAQTVLAFSVIALLMVALLGAPLWPGLALFMLGAGLHTLAPCQKPTPAERLLRWSEE